MVDIVISVAAKIAEYLVAPVGRQFRYVWNYKTNLENLKKEVERLKAKRDTVQLKIKPGEAFLPDVEKWQKSANGTIVEASKVVEDNPEQANIQCCKGFSCPNLMNRYQLSKKAADKLKDVVRLEQEAVDFNEVAYPLIPKQIILQPREGDVAFESRKSILKDIIDALRDPDVNMVGIHGMGGVGKTTLAREVGSEANQHNLFDKIVFVEVSESPDIQIIQRVIADNLGLQFKEEIPVTGRANRLCDQLMKEGKILLILDNIWKGIDFVKVGIPFKNNHKGLKLLLTTRSRNVLTNEMDSQRNFQIHTLNEADAWSLFTNTAGTCTEQPNLQSIAREVAKECGGMPLAIVAVAKALKNKEEEYAWITALQKLKSPSPEGFKEKMTNEVYNSIELSYGCLDGELKEIFLLCSRMGRTYDASIRDLFRYGLGLGFFKGCSTLENAQCYVEDLVRKLKDNSLLLDAPNETRESHGNDIPDSERFAIHDIICDVARSIDHGKGNVCNVIDDDNFCYWAKNNILENCTSITLYNIDELPKDLKLVLPQLKFFYMKTKNTFSRITDDFFAEMSSLLVLHLIEMNLSPLPTSLSHLVNLQTLCLDACQLGDIADVRKLEKLKFLSFCGSKITELPEEMRQLTSIRLLDLNDCFELEIIPPNLLSCFTQLEALYMYNTVIWWEARGLNIGRILDELKHLRGRLTTLEISIPNVKMSEGLLSPHLKRYKISIDHSQISPLKNSRTLRVKLNTNDNVDEVISQLKGIKQLELGCAYRRYGFTDPESRDDESKQSVSLDALFSLESLFLEDLSFEKICNVPLAAESFCQLRTITVQGCDKLTNIFSFSIDRVLPNLQEIKVSLCENMEGIFAIEREDDVNNTELIHEIQFSQLCSVTLENLPKLKSFCHRVKTTSQLQLISSTNDGEIISEDMIDIPKSLFNTKVVFPNLNSLVVHACDNLKELFSSSMVNSFVQLQYLKITACSLLEEMIFMEELKEEERKDTQFPLLKEMTIKYCPNFKGFISNDKIGFPSLKAMEICECPEFKESIFNDKVVFPNLETLYILKISVEKIWHNRLPTISSSFQNLNHLGIRFCDNLKELFPSSMVNSFVQLQYLNMSRCSLLEEMVFMEELKEEERKDIQFPSLKEMRIFNCHNFKRFISNDKIGFPSLKAMTICSCDKFKEFIFNDKVAVPNIEKLTIYGMDNLEKIWHDQLVKDSFCKLKSLEVYHCKRLLNVFPSNIYGRFLSLESLEVRECVSLEEIFDLRGLSIYDTDEEGQMQQPFFLSLDVEIGFPSLKEMKITSCPKLKEFIFNDKVAVPNLEKLTIMEMDNLEKIWHDQLVKDSFGKLKSLEVYDCKKLLNVFPSNIYGRLSSLESLKVSLCHPLEEIFDLRELSIYGSQIMPTFESLKELRVSDCRSLKNLFSASILGKEEVVMEEAPARFLFPKLTSLVLNSLPQLRSFYPGRHKVEVPVLKTLQLFDCGILDTDEEGQMQQTFFLSLAEQAFPCLEELTLDGSHYKMRFPHREDQTQTKIKTLNLSCLKDLKYIWKQNSKLDLIIQHLEVLKVSSCNGLINLMQPPTSFQNPSTSFQNLTSLGVDSSNSLINMGTSSVAKSLVQLTEMSISFCDKITEVIGYHGDVIEDEIIFRKLKSLMLEFLPSLTSFCSWNCTLNFPSLETLTVQWCPNMKIFSQGDLTTEKLQIVKIDYESVELRPNFDLNAAIQQSYEKAISAKDNGASSSCHLE